MMGRSFILLCIVLCLAGATSAQATDPADQQETIRALLEEVKELKARVAALEAKQAPEAPRASPGQSVQPPSAATSPAAAQLPIEEPASFGIFHGIKLQGFGAVTYKASNARPPELGASLGFRPGSAGNFAVGDVDLFLTSQLTSKISVLTELTFSEQATGEFQSDVERLLLKYNANDSLKMSFGRFHSATSYYNSVFHHGFWLQTAVDRPVAVEFSDHGGMLPSQATGASVTGRIPGMLGLNYIFEYGTPDTIRPQISTPDAAEITENNGNETTAGLFLKPDGLPGLDLGGSFYHDRITPAFNGVASGLHIGQTVASAHAVYVTPRFEFLNEAFLIQHKVQETGQTFNTPSFYTLISQKFGSRWRPYFRFQYNNASTGSPIFPDIGLRYGPSAGLRFDFNDYVAMKTQYDRVVRKQLQDFDNLMFQLAFRF